MGNAVKLVDRLEFSTVSLTSLRIKKGMKTFRDFIFEKLNRMRIVMLGESWFNKSTYTEYLIKHFNITHIYPDNMLRKEVEKRTEINKIAKSIIDRGEFVPNQIVLDLIKKKVEQSLQGYVLDGWDLDTCNKLKTWRRMK